MKTTKVYVARTDIDGEPRRWVIWSSAERPGLRPDDSRIVMTRGRARDSKATTFKRHVRKLADLGFKPESVTRFRGIVRRSAELVMAIVETEMDA